MDHEGMISRIVSWATEEEAIRGVVLTGSVARDEGQIHPLSDIDIEIFTTEPERYLLDDSWYAQFGPVVAVEALANLGGYPTRLLYLVDGKIDLLVAPVHALRDRSYDRAFRILVDKDSVAPTARRTTRSHFQGHQPKTWKSA